MGEVLTENHVRSITALSSRANHVGQFLHIPYCDGSDENCFLLEYVWQFISETKNLSSTFCLALFIWTSFSFILHFQFRLYQLDNLLHWPALSLQHFRWILLQCCLCLSYSCLPIAPRCKNGSVLLLAKATVSIPWWFTGRLHQMGSCVLSRYLSLRTKPSVWVAQFHGHETCAPLVLTHPCAAPAASERSPLLPACTAGTESQVLEPKDTKRKACSFLRVPFHQQPSQGIAKAHPVLYGPITHAQTAGELLPSSSRDRKGKVLVHRLLTCIL